MTLHVGFTGTRHGMTKPQRFALRELLSTLQIARATHGDCIGADEEFHNIIRDDHDAFIVARPGFPSTSMLRANCRANVIHPVKPPLVRNVDIVDDGEYMFATPSQSMPQKRGGTWHVVGLTKAANKPLAIVWPDGTVSRERWNQTRSRLEPTLPDE